MGTSRSLRSACGPSLGLHCLLLEVGLGPSLPWRCRSRLQTREAPLRRRCAGCQLPTEVGAVALGMPSPTSARAALSLGLRPSLAELHFPRAAAAGHALPVLPRCPGSSAEATHQSCFLTSEQESFFSAHQSGFHFATFYSDYASLVFAPSQPEIGTTEPLANAQDFSDFKHLYVVCKSLL